MSVHKSLRSSAGDSRNRSVLTRAERIAVMQKAGKHKPGDRVTGLPKTRVDKMKAKGKKKEKAEAAPAAAGAAKPAAGAAPAKGAAKK